MTSNEKQITVKVGECYSRYFDKDVSDSLIDFFSRDSDSTINRINDKIILKYCYNCLKENFLKKKPSIVSDSRCIDLRRLMIAIKMLQFHRLVVSHDFYLTKKNFLKFVIIV